MSTPELRRRAELTPSQRRALEQEPTRTDQVVSWIGWHIGELVAVGLPLLLPVTRWYFKRAAAGYLRESASYAALNGTITESVEGARTVDALSLGARRRAKVDADLTEHRHRHHQSLRDTRRSSRRPSSARLRPLFSTSSVPGLKLQESARPHRSTPAQRSTP